MPSDDAHSGSLVIEMPPLRAALLRGARLLVETTAVPTALLYVGLRVGSLTLGLGLAVGWCYLCVLLRWIHGRRMPGTLTLAASLFTARAGVVLATSSVFAFLIQPIVGSCCMALLFLGSALIRRPVTTRLARDFIHLPAHILRQPKVQRMFRHVALLWGFSRLADAGMNFGMLHAAVGMGLLARGFLSPLLTMTSVLVCAAWGWRCLHLGGIRLCRPASIAKA